MSSEFAIRSTGLAKRYPVGGGRRSRTIRDRVASAFGRADDENAWFWALDDVSFELPRGRALGIVGENGAGKSTVLRILARITEPTRGRVELRGTVASLLDIGGGFHSELTGRENVYLNGAILGMKRSTIASKFESIVEFAEVARHIDSPMKTYSAGTHLRLAFSVAAHLDSDILLVDEVIAVGDARFQRKCLARMSELMRDGRSVVLVSHSLEVVRRLCQDAIWIDRGRVRAEGATGAVVDRYLSESIGRSASVRFDPPEILSTAGGTFVVGIELVGADGTSRSRFGPSEAVSVTITLDRGPVPRDRVGIAIVSSTLEDVAGTFVPVELLAGQGIVSVVCTLDPGALAVGEYTLEVVSASEDGGADLARASRSVSFAILADESFESSDEPRLGMVRVGARWSRDSRER